MLKSFFTQGTVAHSIWRGILSFAVFGITTVLAHHPEWGTITVASIAFAVTHYIETQIT